MPARRVAVSPAVLFGGTLFASSLLMFLLEPMVAKMVLPVLGGAPMVWNTCVLFFQIMLLAGYAYAHGVTRWLGVRRHAGVYALLVLLPLVVLPFDLREAGAPHPGADPTLWLLRELARSIGLPFFVLSTTASLLQRLFAESDHPSAGDPYFLYAASNLGSLVALVAYPALAEPLLTLGDQARVWSVGYAVLAVLVIGCVAATWFGPLCASLREFCTRCAPHSGPSRAKRGQRYWQPAAGLRGDIKGRSPVAGSHPSDAGRVSTGEEVPALPLRRRLYWMALAAVPSSLMLSVTSYMSTDVAAVPLLWILPLSLFLLTFVLVFGDRGNRWLVFARKWFPLAITPVAAFVALQLAVPIWVAIPLHLAAFFVTALLCHGTLAHDRPPVSQLTAFYLWIALGGVIGGAFNTLVAPVLFNSIVEYPLFLALAAVVYATSPGDGPSRRVPLKNIVVPLAFATGLAAFAAWKSSADARLAITGAAFAIPIVVYAIQFRQRLLFTVTMAGLLLGGLVLASQSGRAIHTERTFYGVYRVTVDPSGQYRQLISGTTLHGRQTIDAGRHAEPLTYYHREGPLGEALQVIPSVQRADAAIGAVGLGVGTVATYAREGQRWTFYEIDPAVERIARAEFTYLPACGGRCDVVLGDARVVLARERPHAYALLILDAFSSDAIPMHLLTREALELYLTHLATDGVLAVHISNRHLDLAPVLERLARTLGLEVRERIDTSGVDEAGGRTGSHWVLLAREVGHFGALSLRPAWREPRAVAGMPVWTDDFSNIFSALKIRSGG